MRDGMSPLAFDAGQKKSLLKNRATDSRRLCPNASG